MASYGYARCSLSTQKVSMQVELLKQAGCERVFIDEGVSGAKAERPGYQELLSVLQAGDTVVVYKLDRIARSTRDLLNKIDHLTQMKVGFRSLTEQIDLDTAAGELMLHLLGSFASFERAMLIERTRAGIQSARLAGKRIGRPPALNPSSRLKALGLISTGASIPCVAKSMGISRSAMYRYVRDGL